METALKILAEYGPMGAVCAALFGIVIWLVRIVVGRESQMVDVVKDNSTVIQKLTDVLNRVEADRREDHNRFQNLQQKTYNSLISRPCMKGRDE